jgi:hypothetical protein
MQHIHQSIRDTISTHLRNEKRVLLPATTSIIDHHYTEHAMPAVLTPWSIMALHLSVGNGHNCCPNAHYKVHHRLKHMSRPPPLPSALHWCRTQEPPPLDAPRHVSCTVQCTRRHDLTASDQLSHENSVKRKPSCTLLLQHLLQHSRLPSRSLRHLLQGATMHTIGVNAAPLPAMQAVQLHHHHIAACHAYRKAKPPPMKCDMHKSVQPRRNMASQSNVRNTYKDHIHRSPTTSSPPGSACIRPAHH